MKLSDLLRDVPVREVHGNTSIDITSVTPDSRLVGSGGLFVAIPGTARDGTAFIPQAMDRDDECARHRQPHADNRRRR